MGGAGLEMGTDWLENGDGLVCEWGLADVRIGIAGFEN